VQRYGQMQGITGPPARRPRPGSWSSSAAGRKRSPGVGKTHLVVALIRALAKAQAQQALEDRMTQYAIPPWRMATIFMLLYR